MDTHGRISNVLHQLNKLREEHEPTEHNIKVLEVKPFTPIQKGVIETLIKLTYILYHDV